MPELGHLSGEDFEGYCAGWLEQGHRPEVSDWARVRCIDIARDDMLNPEKQREVREEWKREGWTRHVTSTLRCAIDANALEAYAERPEANVVPVDKHGVPYRGTEREMIQKLLGRASRRAGARWATVVVRYWYGHMGAALVDAGLVSTSREYAVPPDRDVDPFALPRRLRTLALGPFHDFDDAAAHPRARAPCGRPRGGRACRGRWRR